jgi:hypothetical protein
MSSFFHGAYRISLRSQFDGAIGHYADFFTQKPASKPLAPRWWTSLEGNLDSSSPRGVNKFHASSD